MPSPNPSDFSEKVNGLTFVTTANLRTQQLDKYVHVGVARHK